MGQFKDWNDVKNYAVQKLGGSELENGSVAFELPNPGDSSRDQYITVFGAGNGQWVKFITIVCSADQMSYEEALTYNLGRLAGFLALGNGLIWMVHAQSIETMDTDEFLGPLYILSKNADELEKKHAGGDVF